MKLILLTVHSAPNSKLFLIWNVKTHQWNNFSSPAPCHNQSANLSPPPCLCKQVATGTAFLYLQRSKQPNLSGWSWNAPHTHYDGWLETESCVKEETLMALSWNREGEEGGWSRADAHFTPGSLFVDRLGGWDWRVMLMEAYIRTRANQEEHGGKKQKTTRKKKCPLGCLAVCKLQLNSTNRHTERWIIARDTKVLAVHMAAASSPETTCSLSCLLRARKYNRIYI